MPAMSQIEIESFLAEPRHAIVGTNRVQGPPQLSPVWYLYEAGKLYIGITANTAKYHNLRRDPGITICIDGCHPDARTVTIYGKAGLVEKGDPLQEDMRWRIIRRYQPDEESARRYAESTRDLPSVLIVVSIEKIISQDFN